MRQALDVRYCAQHPPPVCHEADPFWGTQGRRIPSELHLLQNGNLKIYPPQNSLLKAYYLSYFIIFHTTLSSPYSPLAAFIKRVLSRSKLWIMIVMNIDDREDHPNSYFHSVPD